MPQVSKFLSSGQKFVPGILGGLGPASHVLFEEILLRQNLLRGNGRTDQSYPVWILISASSTPDRTKALLHEGKNSLPHLQYYAQIIETAGADGLFVICNTAHAFHREVQKELKIPWVHMMDLTATAIVRDFPHVSKVGVLATDGTLTSKLYHEVLAAKNLHIITPQVGSSVQKDVMDAIYHPEFGIKSTATSVSTTATRKLVEAAKWCHAQGAQLIIAACTEISLALNNKVYQDAPVIDPLVVAADAVLDLSFGVKKPRQLFKKY